MLAAVKSTAHHDILMQGSFLPETEQTTLYSIDEPETCFSGHRVLVVGVQRQQFASQVPTSQVHVECWLLVE